MPVNSQCDEYKRMLPKWTRCRDASEGQDAVHAAGEKYLPKLKDQTPEDYAAYRLRTPFYNASWRTMSGLIGMLFMQPPKIEAPVNIKDNMLDDVTMSGVPLQMFAQNVCEEALKCGRLGVLVDYPQAPAEGLTMADAKAQNLRPMMLLYRTEAVINWRMGRVNNVSCLVLVVLKEQVEIQKDEFTTVCEDRYRVLDIVGGQYRVRTFKMDGDREVQLSEVIPLMNNKPLEFIPFTFLSTDDNTSEVDEPPLIDLVDVNLSHYRSTADLEHGAHFTGLPTAVVSGYKKVDENEKLYIGSTAAWIFPSEKATAKFLEFTGQGLTALQTVIDKKETQMAILGARMLEPQKKAVQTAASESIHRKGEESMLSMAAQSISLGMTRALEWFCMWAGATVEKGKVVFELNRDFYPVPMTPQMLTALVAGWQAGAFSDQVLFEQLQQGEIIGADTTLEDEQARLATQDPQLTPGLPDNVSPLKKPPAANAGTKRKITGPNGQSYIVEPA